VNSDELEVFFGGEVTPEERAAINGHDETFRILVLSTLRVIQVDIITLKRHDSRDYADLKVLEFKARWAAVFASAIISVVVTVLGGIALANILSGTP